MPEDRTTQQSNLCSLGPRPQIMTGLFVSLLQDHFADADNIEHAVFRDRLYVAGEETKILIEDATVWTPDRTQKRPAIIVKRNAWKHLKRYTLANTGVTEEGYVGHSKVWRGSHTIFCVAPKGGETETLAAETYLFLMRFGPVFRQYFQLLQFELVDIGALSQLEEDSTHYVVPITVMYGWDETWNIRQHVSPMRDVRLSRIFSTYLDD